MKWQHWENNISKDSLIIQITQSSFLDILFWATGASKCARKKDFIVVIFRALLYFYIEPSLKDVTIINDTFVDFTTIGFWSYFLDSVTGCCAFLAWIRIFKYVSFNKVVIYF